MPTYRERPNPPQVQGTDFECQDCGAIVGNTARHNVVCRAQQVEGITPADRSGDPRQAGPRQ